MMKWGCIYSEMEGEGRHGQNSQTLVNPCQLPTWLVETHMGKRVICGICLKVTYATLTTAYIVSKWRTQLQSNVRLFEYSTLNGAC